MPGLTAGALIAEKERLQAVVDQARDARAELARIDRALVLLGVLDQESELASGRGGDMPCETCGRTFKNKSSLRSHERDAHQLFKTPDHQVPCPHCDKTARSNTGLVSHIRAAHPEVAR